MAVVAARQPPGPAGRRASEFCIALGIVNNMPDSALERTERQFFHLLGAAAHDLLVRVSFYSLADLARGDAGLAHLAHNGYRPSRELAGASLDALIVTGTEPRVPDLKGEPYWAEFAQLFDWIAEDGPSTVFSCLAAHAAVLHYDGIARQRLREKRFGVFEHVVAGHDAFTEHLRAPTKVAHSRWHEVDEAELAGRGYRILTWSRDAGVDLFLRRGRNDLLFAQGHPEYDPATLAREYRRDVRRFLAGENANYPALPQNYFTANEQAALLRFRERAQKRRDESLLADFPILQRRSDSKWQPPAANVFRAWLLQIVESKRRRRTQPRYVGTSALALAEAS